MKKKAKKGNENAFSSSFFKKKKKSIIFTKKRIVMRCNHHNPNLFLIRFQNSSLIQPNDSISYEHILRIFEAILLRVLD